MNESKTAGCSVFTILGVLLVIAVGVIALLLAFCSVRQRSVRHHPASPVSPTLAFSSTSGDEQETVTLTPEVLGRWSPADVAGGLTREQFVAMMSDSKATELARKAFVERANGQVVRWLLKAVEVREAAEGGLTADFQLPYRIQTHPNSWTGSALTIQAEFAPEQRERLIEVRREDWTTVEGRLELDGGNVRLRDARVAGPGEPERAER